LADRRSTLAETLLGIETGKQRRTTPRIRRSTLAETLLGIETYTNLSQASIVRSTLAETLLGIETLR
jgi:hypothetical protein